MDSKSFKSWLYERLVSEDIIDSSDFDEEDLCDYDTVLSLDDVDIDESRLETYAYQYKQECEQNSEEPDFEGFEELA